MACWACKENQEGVFLKLPHLFLSIFFLKLAQFILALTNPYDYYELDETVIVYVILELATILIFFIVSYKLRPIEVSRVEARRSLKSLKQLYIVPAFLFFLIMFYYKITLNLSLQQLRDLFYFGTDFIIGFGSINYLIFIYTALGYILLYSGIILKDQKAVLVALGSMLLFDVAQGGRMSFYYAFFLLWSIYFVSDSSKFLFKIKWSRAKYAVLVSYFVVITLGIITVSRMSSGEGMDLFEFLYVYLIGPIYLFSEAVKASDTAFAMDGRIGASFMSLDWAIVGVLKFYYTSLETLYATLDGILATGYYFNNSYGMNAHFTSNFFLYVEYGYLGVLFFPVLLVGISRLRMPLANFLIYLLVFSYFISVREHFINSPIFIIALLLYPLFVKKVKYV